MHAEAAPVVARLGLDSAKTLHPRLPALVHSGEFSGTVVDLVVNGVDARFGVDAIGTVPAALTAWTGALEQRSTLIISAGTAGGFARHGANIGDIYLSEGPLVFHDRRIPLAGFEAYGRGSLSCMEAGPLARALGLKLGRFTTGDSLDLCDADAAAIESSGAAVKDMEAAAVAWVAHLLGVPFLGVKAITDLVDGPHPTADQFVLNLDRAVAELADALPRILMELQKADVARR
jgi:nucleoside phosphorylase